jgi:transmembrane sensor
VSSQPLLDSERINRANQAADWFVRVSDDEVSEQDLTEWLHWCADPENLLEFQRIRNTWAGFDKLRPEAERQLLAMEVKEDRRLIPVRPFVHRAYRGWLSVAAAAAVVSGIAVSVLWYAHDAGVFSPAQRTVASIGTPQSTVLSDGSTLVLAPKTNVAVDFSGASRRLELSQGEAYFKVRPNKQKPFVVRAGAVVVTAVGTAFDVRSEPGRVIVAVQEGTVSVAGLNQRSDGSDNWRVSAGNQVSYDTSSHTVRVSAIDAARALSWQTGRLEYFDEPLSAVVADVNRYSARQIEVGDPNLGELAFTGTIFTNSIDDWLEAMQSTFPVRAVVTKDNRVIFLSSSSATAAPAQ